MNACDADAPGRGVEPQYRAGLEISFSDDAEPPTHRGAAQGLPGPDRRGGGQWIVHAGPPAPAVYAFTDDDVIVTAPRSSTRSPGSTRPSTASTPATPSPRTAGSRRRRRRRLNAGYLAEDGGRLQVAPLSFPAVPHRAQVQRLMASALKDSRRFRRHTVVLPPEARALGPLDVVEWTSARNGYEAKLFTVDLVEDLPIGCVAAALREVDPTDYDFAATTSCRPTSAFSAGRRGCRGRSTSRPRASSLPDAAGTGRRPAIRLGWNPETRA